MNHVNSAEELACRQQQQQQPGQQGPREQKDATAACVRVRRHPKSAGRRCWCCRSGTHGRSDAQARRHTQAASSVCRLPASLEAAALHIECPEYVHAAVRGQHKAAGARAALMPRATTHPRARARAA